MSPLLRIFFYTVIAADVLAVVFFSGHYIIHGSILPEETEAKIVVEGAATASSSAAPAKEAAAPFDYAKYTAVAANGEKISAKCKACHSLGKGEPAHMGPNLWEVVGRKPGAHEGFSYSSAMVAKGNEIKTWDESHLFAFLESPKDYVAGTKMQFNGVKDPKDRADLIAYLKTLK